MGFPPVFALVPTQGFLRDGPHLSVVPDGQGNEFEAYVHEALKPPSFDLKILAWAIEDLHRRTPYL